MSISLCVFATADIHGRLLPAENAETGQKTPGGHSLAQVAALLKERRKTCCHSIFLDGGDTIQGSALVHYFGTYGKTDRHPALAGLAMMGCDAMVPGNHDLDFGRKRAESFAAASAFPWLAANLVDRSHSEPLFGKAYTLLTRGPLSIAVVGLTTRSINQLEDSVLALDEIESLRRYLKDIREEHRVDLTIVVYHGGTEGDPVTGEPIAKSFENRGLEILEKVEGIDILITGHQHRNFALIKGGTALVQPGAFADGLAEIRVEFEDELGNGTWTVRSMDARIWDPAGYAPDDEFIEGMAPFVQEAEDWEGEVLATLEQACPVRNLLMDICTHEHPLIRWLNEVQMKTMDAEISVTSFVNEKCEGFKVARVTRKDVVEFFPYTDKLQLIEMTGNSILQVLEYAATLFELPEGGMPGLEVAREWMIPHFRIYDYPMWQGMDYSFDVSRPAGSRVRYCRIAGRNLDPEQIYRVAATDFFVNMINTVLNIDHKTILRSEGSIPDLLMEDAREGGLISLVKEPGQVYVSLGAVSGGHHGN